MTILLDTESVVKTFDEEMKNNILDACEEVSVALTKIEDQKEHIKDIKDRVKEEFKLDPKLFFKIAKTMHNASFQNERKVNEDFQLLYETLTNDEQ
jgi:predicted  nucleic acid-binding Zn-ribbon protein